MSKDSIGQNKKKLRHYTGCVKSTNQRAENYNRPIGRAENYTGSILNMQRRDGRNPGVGPPKKSTETDRSYLTEPNTLCNF